MSDTETIGDVQGLSMPSVNDSPTGDSVTSPVAEKSFFNPELHAHIEHNFKVRQPPSLELGSCKKMNAKDEAQPKGHLNNATLSDKTKEIDIERIESSNAENTQFIVAVQAEASSTHSKPLQYGSDKSIPPSPSNSISSLSSSESTHKLIKSLSVSGQDSAQGTPFVKTDSGIDETVDLKQTDVDPIRIPKSEYIETKKPIKFTVRKVSREATGAGETKTSEKTPISQRYGNLPENRAQANSRKHENRLSQLEDSQAKYDSYSTRVDKIDKEIRFLSTLLPPHNVEIDYATRSKITRAIDKLGNKKDEVEKKRYELGTSISRLWREFEDNNTWVRSVSKH